MLSSISRSKIYIPLFFVLLSVIYGLFCIDGSPFFKILYFTDSATYQIMGQGILEGKLPYRDLFEHKGIAFFFLEALIMLLKSWGLNGLFIVETVFFLLGISYLYKICRIYLPPAYSLSVCVLYTFLFTKGIIGGNLIEEYANSIMFVGTFYMLQILLKKEVSSRNFFIIGLTFAFNFLTKPNMCIPWAAFGLTYPLIAFKGKRFATLLKEGVWIILGIITTIALPLSYLLYHNLWNDFIYGFWTMNFSYDNGTLPEKIASGRHLLLYVAGKPFPHLSLVSILGFILFIPCALQRGRKTEFLFLFVTFLLSFILGLFSGRAYIHYITTVLFGLTLGLILFVRIFRNLRKTGWLTLIVCLCFFANQCRERFQFFTNPPWDRYLRAATFLEDKVDPTKKEELLVLGHGSGIYLKLNLPVDFKFFHADGIWFAHKDVQKETFRYVEEKRPHFLVLSRGVNFKRRYRRLKKIVEKHYKEVFPRVYERK